MNIAARSIVVIFDGMCNLCDATVSYLHRADGKGLLRFIPFQGDEGTLLLKDRGLIAPPDSVYVITHEGLFLKEDEAMIYLLGVLGGVNKLISILVRRVPAFIRKPIYRWMSRNRYLIFGKRDSCRAPL